VGAAASFTVQASGTPPLAYRWERDEKAIPEAHGAAYTTGPTTIADSGARFRCVVTNAHGAAASDAATLTVLATMPPAAAITSPPASARYDAGTVLPFAGTATDAEDGVLPASAYTWWIDFHHDDHRHPALAPRHGVTGGAYAVPDRGETSANVWYRIHLRVTDADGLTHAASRDVRPNTALLRLASEPPGLALLLDGQPVATPADVPSVVGLHRTLGVPSPQVVDGVTWTFADWSDGGARTHEVATSGAGAALTARFTAVQHLAAVVAALDGTVTFGRPGHDRFAVRGVLGDLPPGFAPRGRRVTLDVGGATLEVVLDARGRASTPDGTFRLRLGRPPFRGGDVAFTARRRRGSFAGPWSAHGIDAAATVRNASVRLPVAVALDERRWEATLDVRYSGKAARRGRFRMR
jgi:hypothetical protein